MLDFLKYLVNLDCLFIIISETLKMYWHCASQKINKRISHISPGRGSPKYLNLSSSLLSPSLSLGRILEYVGGISLGAGILRAELGWKCGHLIAHIFRTGVRDCTNSANISHLPVSPLLYDSAVLSLHSRVFSS